MSRQVSPELGWKREQLKQQEQIGCRCGQDQARAINQRLEVERPETGDEDQDRREPHDRLLIFVEARGAARKREGGRQERKNEQTPPAPVERRSQRAPAR